LDADCRRKDGISESKEKDCSTTNYTNFFQRTESQYQGKMGKWEKWESSNDETHRMKREIATE
jgi:hypothetical protein